MISSSALGIFGQSLTNVNQTGDDGLRPIKEVMRTNLVAFGDTLG